jgi:hypothetical protein
MRRLAVCLLLVVIGLPLLLVCIVFLAVEERPALHRTAELRPQQIERARRILERNDPRKLKSGEIRTISISQEDLDLAVNYLANRYAGGSARVELTPGVAHVTASVRLPGDDTGAFLNIDAILLETSTLPRLDKVWIGRVRVPEWLATRLVASAIPRLTKLEDHSWALHAIQRVALRHEAVSVTYEWQDQFQGLLQAAAVPQQDLERLRAYQERLAAVTRDGKGALSLAGLTQPLLSLAAERSGTGEAAAENRSAILVLTCYVIGARLAELVPESRGWPQPASRAVTLDRRSDLAKHFVVSAALAAHAGQPLADAIGVYKEVEDSRSRSGFSFRDIAADRAGSRFGELAAGSEASARRLQAVTSEGPQESTFMPYTADLPESMPQAEFTRRFGGVGGREYERMMREIDRRVAALLSNAD